MTLSQTKARPLLNRTRHSYAVFFNGVFLSRHARKGAALDAAYSHVNTAQHVNATHAAKGSVYCAEQADRFGHLLGVLASTIPAARKSATRTGNHILHVGQAGASILVRRDTF